MFNSSGICYNLLQPRSLCEVLKGNSQKYSTGITNEAKLINEVSLQKRSISLLDLGFVIPFIQVQKSESEANLRILPWGGRIKTIDEGIITSSLGVFWKKKGILIFVYALCHCLWHQLKYFYTLLLQTTLKCSQIVPELIIIYSCVHDIKHIIDNTVSY